MQDEPTPPSFTAPAKTATADRVAFDADIATAGDFSGVIVNELISGLGDFRGSAVTATMGAAPGSQRQAENAVVANAESPEMSWLVGNAQNLGDTEANGC